MVLKKSSCLLLLGLTVFASASLVGARTAPGQDLGGRKLLTWGPCADNENDCSHSCENAKGAVVACCAVGGIYVDCNNVPVTLLSAGVLNGRKLQNWSPCADNKNDCSHSCHDAEGGLVSCCAVGGIYVDCNNVPVTLASAGVLNGRKLLSEGPCAVNENDCSHACENAHGAVVVCCAVGGIYVDCNNVPVTLLSGLVRNGR
jgi:hypothetical protein